MEPTRGEKKEDEEEGAEDREGDSERQKGDDLF